MACGCWGIVDKVRLKLLTENTPKKGWTGKDTSSRPSFFGANLPDELLWARLPIGIKVQNGFSRRGNLRDLFAFQGHDKNLVVVAQWPGFED